MSKPSGSQYIVIIGAMKAATSSLFYYLSEHPAICPASTKETEHFAAFQTKEDLRGHIADWFEFDPNRHEFALEASPQYTKLEQGFGCAERMLRQGVAPRLVYVLRDPLERIESQVNYMRRLQPGRWRDGFCTPHVVAASSYATMARRFSSVLGRESLYFVDFRSLRANPLGEVNRLLNEFGLEPLGSLRDPTPRNTTDYSASIMGRRIEAALVKAGSVLPEALRSRFRPLRTVFKDLNAGRAGKDRRIRMSDSERRYLRSILHPEVVELRGEFGVEFADWGLLRDVDI